MSGPNRPGELPPDLPPEYAEAYRRGYERAYERGPENQIPGQQIPERQVPEQQGQAQPAPGWHGPQGPAPQPPSQQPEPVPEQTTRLDSLDSMFEPVEAGDRQSRPIHREPGEAERRRTLVPVLLVGLALLLVLSAYGLGRLFSSGVDGVDTAEPEPDGVVLSEDEPAEQKPKRQKYEGRVDPAAIGGATASCQSDSSVDAAGRKVGYAPGNIYDGDNSTAWRCDGAGVGQRVTVTLPEKTTIGEVGLIPGYAKTDAASGADRYAENNRITQVRWLFDDGSSATQRFDGSAGNRSLQSIRIPETDTDRVVIEILGSTPGPRNTVAISEVLVGAVAG